MFSAREARNIVRKQVKRVPEGEEIRHLNIMPMMDMMTILLVAFIFQAAVTATALQANEVALPHSMNEEPMPENASTLIITPKAIVVEGDEVVSVREGGVIDASEIDGGARGFKIKKLAAELKQLHDTELATAKDPTKPPELMIIADRSTPFRLLFNVIYSAKGDKDHPLYKRFRLIVQKHEPILK